jgi:two-component system response regulator AtoC
MIKNPIRILVIEDEEFDIRRIKKTVAPFSQIIISDIVSSGSDALKLISQKNIYDVIIMDLQIAGGIMGEELIREIKKINPFVQIIVITKMTIYQTNFDFANRLIQAGAFWFCTKYPGDIDSYIYQPTDFILSIVNAFEKKQLELEHHKSKKKLNQNIQDILTRKIIIGKSSVIEKLKQQINQYAESNANIIIYGKSGTGKELVALNIHYLSSRRFEYFVPINCGSIPGELIESELFGFEKGSFTGAQESRAGLFEQANGGTVFLDEISEFPLSAQSKLLRVLQEGQIDKIGRKKDYHVDVRIIAATNKDLEKMVTEKQFREDLFYRLNVLQIYVPDLAERKEDIPILIEYYLNLYSKEMGRISPEFESGAMEILVNYAWPGNIRQLQNVTQRILFLCQRTISREAVFNAIGIKIDNREKTSRYDFNPENIVPLKAVEKQFRKEYLKFVREQSQSDAECAQKLGLAPPNYYRIAKELGLK